MNVNSASLCIPILFPLPFPRELGWHEPSEGSEPRDYTLIIDEFQEMKTLVTLNRIRNGLVHGEKQTSDLTREETLELIDAFRVGAN